MGYLNTFIKVIIGKKKNNKQTGVINMHLECVNFSSLLVITIFKSNGMNTEFL